MAVFQYRSQAIIPLLSMAISFAGAFIRPLFGIHPQRFASYGASLHLCDMNTTLVPNTTIETERLILMPLTYEALLQYTQNDGTLEKHLNLAPSQRQISPALKEALEQTILPGVKAAGENYFFSTLWSVILKAEQQMVGDLCFMGMPDEQGAIEVGYGTYEAFWGRGLMTEALGGLLRWAEQQPGVRMVTAKTEPSNAASYAVLAKNGFQKTAEGEGVYHWVFCFR
jgi:[ribosomal protein S5]-alanine N-acetyltransferase